MNIRTRLGELLVERSVRLGDFTLASGARSAYYIDARRTTMTAEGQALTGKVCWDALRASALDFSHVGGLTMGADPVSYAIAHASWRAGRPIDAFSVRKQAKEHGTGRRIEGNFATGRRALVIEDVITSGGSALQACDAVEAEGGTITGAGRLLKERKTDVHVVDVVGSMGGLSPVRSRPPQRLP